MNRDLRHDWHYVPDACLERILLHVPPRTKASLRLVSRSWRNQVSYTLTKLALQSGCDLEGLLRSFPSIGTLTLTLGRSNGVSLQSLSTLQNLTSLAIMGPDVRPLALPLPFSDVALAQIAAMPRLTHLTLVKVAIDFGGSISRGLQELDTLKSLRLRGVKLRNINKKTDFFSILETLQGLEALEVDELTFEDGSSGGDGDAGSPSTSTANISSNTNVDSTTIKWHQALSKMKSLNKIRLGGSSIPITDELCSAVASLPKLSSLELSRPGWWGYTSENTAQIENNGTNNSALSTQLRLPTLTEDGGLAALAARASTLRHLSLCGCFAVTSNAAVHHIAALTSLTSLDFRTYSGEEETSRRQNINLNNNFLQQHNQNYHIVELKGACLARLTALKHLERLHLGGWPVSVSTARALGRLPSLQRLEFSNCWDLDDSVVFELAKMSKLQHLALRRCVAVSDIGLAALAKGSVSQSLTSLDLKGCHKNVTDQGLTAIQGLQKLRLLDVSGCELVSDVGIARGLAKMKFLEHVGLSDTQVTDYGCSLLATATPLLRVVEIEYCKITDTGADALVRLKRLHEVRAFGSSMTAQGAQVVSEKTGAVVSLRKPCWWSKTSPSSTSTSNSNRVGPAKTGSEL
jgi:hypothetical protein